MSSREEAATPDLTNGIPVRSVPEGGMARGHVGDDEVMIAHVGDRYFAVGAHCTHYRADLSGGVLVGDTVRCPNHHACFSLQTGEALRAPALDPIACWRVDRQGEMLFVREKLDGASAS